MNGEPSNEALLADLERDEAWLAEVLAAHPTPPCGSLPWPATVEAASGGCCDSVKLWLLAGERA